MTENNNNEWQDVTRLTEFGNPDDEILPLKKCVCGIEFELWNFVISIYQDAPAYCFTCGREYYFSNNIHIYSRKGNGSND